MKFLINPALVVFAILLSVSATTLHGHGAGEKILAGPNGGRVLTKAEPRAEFFVMKDRKVQITFLGEDGKPVAPAAQVVTVTAGDRAAPTTLRFAKSGEVLISDATLPAGNEFPAVVQIKTTPEHKAVTERFNVNLAVCGECNRAEYACTCGH